MQPDADDYRHQAKRVVQENVHQQRAEATLMPVTDAFIREGRKGCDRRVEGVAESKKLMDLIIPIANNQKNHVMTFTSGCMVNGFFRIPLSGPFIREAKRKHNKDDFVLLQVRNHICKNFLCFIEH